MQSISVVSNKQPNHRLALAVLLTVLATSVSPVVAQVTITCPPDMTVSNDPGLCSAVVAYPPPGVSGTNGTEVVMCDPVSGSTFPVGTNEVVCTVSEASTNLASCSFNITVDDLEPPSITGVGVNKSLLWPPNHKLIRVTVNYQAHDNCDPSPNCTLTVVSNEAADGLGDGSTRPDWLVVDAHHVMLRAERSGKGDGRTYTITITCTDQSGNSASAQVTVRVPHDRGRHTGAQHNNASGSGNGNGGNGHGNHGGGRGH